MKNFKVGITNKEVINAFRTLVADKVPASDDIGWSSRLIYFYLLRYRAKLIREKVRRSRHISHWNYQTIDCVPLVEADLNECPCAPKSGCTFLKTELPIPKPLNRLKSVTSIDGQITYTFVEWERLKSKINSRIKAQQNTPFFTIKTRNNGTYLYLYNDAHKKFITITGVFENPLQVQYFPNCQLKVKKCQMPLDEEFILDPDLLPTVYDMAFSQLMRAKQHGTDQLNDDNDNIVKNPTKVK